MKIYFLLMLISVFVGFSFIPLRAEAKQKTARSPDSVPA
jgi:preprotein translocase subunit YajC